MNKAIKYKVYPTAKQRTLIAKTFGCCRKVYNLMLSDKIAYYKEHGTMLMTTPAKYKKEYPFLKEVDSLALANAQLNLQKAYSNFFKRKNCSFPKYKSAKRSKQSYTTNNQKGSITITEKGIKLPKLGIVKAKIHRKPDNEWMIKSATISIDSVGDYFISVLFEYKSSIKQSEITEDSAIGIDYKSNGLFVDSNGKNCNMPHYYKLSKKSLAKQQRMLKKKVVGSKNYKKQQKKVSKIHRRIANQRKDYLHKKSTEIANLYSCVCVESLSIKSMSNKKFGNGKATLDNGYGMFLSFLDYKLSDRGGRLIKIDRWFPSSQICHWCGKKNPELKNLKIRRWDCPNCGRVGIDRDLNAALNIKSEGLRTIDVA